MLVSTIRSSQFLILSVTIKRTMMKRMRMMNSGECRAKLRTALDILFSDNSIQFEFQV